MIEKQYKSLCKECDRLFCQKLPLARMSISWINIVRAHPTILKKYEVIFKTNFIFLASLYFRKFKYSLWWAFFISKVFLNKKNLSYKTNNNIDYLFISHLVNKSQFSDSQDFYFGKLPNLLKKQGYKVKIFFIDHINSKSNFHSNNNRSIFLNNLDFKEELLIHKRLRDESKFLRNANREDSSSNISSRVIEIAAAEALSSSSHFNYRLASQIKEIVKKTNPKVLISTYEGHAWEKVAFFAARESKSDIYCIGYHQNALLFRLQHGLRDIKDSRYNPNLIVASGKASYHQLKARSDILCKIKILGSPRYFVNKFQKERWPKKVCLVIPEGIFSECKLLFDFSINCAIKHPEINFIWRLHPLMNFDYLKKRISRYKNLPKNILLSSGAIEIDAKKAQWVLYRGSTAVVQACSYGAIPLYFEKPNEISNDSFYDIPTRKIICKFPNDFSRAISHQAGVITKNYNNVLIRYCRSFYSKLNPHVIDLRSLS